MKKLSFHKKAKLDQHTEDWRKRKKQNFELMKQYAKEGMTVIIEDEPLYERSINQKSK